MSTAFHFLRPEWLWALVPALALGWLLLRRAPARATRDWSRYVDAHLLRHLALDGTQMKRSPLLPVLAALCVVATILALAGPTWQEREMPAFEGGEPVVTVLSLAQSMNSDDVSPSRLKRAGHKLRDVLRRTQGDERGLVIYADTPFVAAPLTSDPNVIEEMLPELSTSLMPVLGNRLDKAITAAQGMLERANAARGTIVVMADDAGNDPAASLAAARAAAQAGYTLSVLGVGTEDGAALQTADHRAITRGDGQTLTAKLAKDDLAALAKAGNGHFATITANSADLDVLLPDQNAPMTAGKEQPFQTDGWVDMGYWLLIIPAVLLPFAFRRGLILSLALLGFGLVQPQPASAGVWQDLWATRDQQGQRAYQDQEFDQAAELFQTPAWQGAAAYRDGDYATASQKFASDAYNRANALAKAGQFKEALASYDAELAAHPDNADAQFNRDLVEKLLQQQEQEQEQQSQDASQQQSDAGGQQDQKSGENQSGESQSGDNQSGENQSGKNQSGENKSGDSAQQQSQSGGQDQSQSGDQDQSQSGDQNQSQQQSGGDGSQQPTGSDGQQQSAGNDAQDPSAAGADQQRSENGAQQPSQQSADAGDQNQPAGDKDDNASAAQDQAAEDTAQASAAQQAEDSAAAQGQQNAEQSAGQNPDAQKAENDAAAQADNANGAQTPDEQTGLGQQLTDMLNTDSAQPAEQVEGSVPGAKPVNQAVEQQLRRVVDDPSGLLRARIRQHYARLRAGN